MGLFTKSINDKDLEDMLNAHNIPKQIHGKCETVFERHLKNKYSDKAVIQKLLHQASFDKNVFIKYFKKRSISEGPVCYNRKHDEAVKLGFDAKSVFGGILVSLADFWFENHPDRRNNVNEEIKMDINTFREISATGVYEGKKVFSINWIIERNTCQIKYK